MVYITWAVNSDIIGWPNCGLDKMYNKIQIYSRRHRFRIENKTFLKIKMAKMCRENVLPIRRLVDKVKMCSLRGHSSVT